MENMSFYSKMMLILALVKMVYVMDDKVHFSMWLKFDNNNVYGDSFIFETVLGKGLEVCIESCKAKKMCSYINFNVKADMCSLIGRDDALGKDDAIGNQLEAKKGFIFGNKTEWNLGEFEICSACAAFGVCKPEGDADDVYAHCKDSGCGPPKSIPYTVVRGNMYTIDDKAEYKCSRGYKDINDTAAFTTTCQRSGNWSQVNIRCLPDSMEKILGNSGNSLYFLIKKKTTWEDAQAYCKTFGGYLAIINSEEIYQETKMLLDDNGVEETWLGGNDRKNEKEWIWSDGTHFSDGFEKWYGKNPDNSGNRENCLTTWVEERQWNDAKCSRNYSSLCEIEV